MEKTKYFYKKVHLVVEIVIGIDGPDELVADEELRCAMEDNLGNFEDGRQLFSVETFKKGLEDVVVGAMLIRLVDRRPTKCDSSAHGEKVQGATCLGTTGPTHSLIGCLESPRYRSASELRCYSADRVWGTTRC